MENDIVRGIATLIKNEFGDGFNIYNEKVKQGFNTPCFFIESIGFKYSKLSLGRYNAKYDFDIHYFSSENSVNDDIRNTQIKMLSCSEKIEVDNYGLIFGKNISSSVQDEVLHFLISYDTQLMDVEDEIDKMQQIKVEVD